MDATTYLKINNTHTFRDTEKMKYFSALTLDNL